MFIATTIQKYLNEKIFKTVKIDDEISDFISDWKTIIIKDIEYHFMRLSGVEENIFVIEGKSYEW